MEKKVLYHPDYETYEEIEVGQQGDEVYSFHTALLTYFNDLYVRAEANKELVFGKHWSPQEEQDHIKQGRIPLNFPLLYRVVMNLLGYEKNYPALIQTLPKGREDDLTSFLVNQQLKHIQELTEPVRYEYQRSDVFTNGNVGLFGCAEICVREDALGEKEIFMKSIPYNQVMFDINFTDYEMSTCSRVQYFEDVWKEDLIEEYPHQEQRIRALSESIYNDSLPRYQKLRNFYDEAGLSRDKEILRKIVDYSREIADKFYVIAEDKTYGGFATREDADDFRKAIKEEDAPIKTEREFCWYKTVTVLDQIVEERTMLEVYDVCPLTFYFPIFMNGMFTNIVEICRDLQRYADRLYSQADFNMGVAGKIIYEANKQLLDPTQSDEERQEVFRKGGFLWTRTDKKVFNQMITTPLDAQHFAMIDGLKMIMEDSFGGKNFQGVQQYSNQSGIAIQNLQAQAVLLASVYISNLERYSELLGKKLVKYIGHYYDKEKAFKIQGDYMNQDIIEMLQENKLYEKSYEENMGYVLANVEGMPQSSLGRSFKYAIKIVNKEYNRFEKNTELEKLMVLQQQGMKIPPDMLAYFLDLDPIITHRLLKEYTRQQQLAEAQMVADTETTRMKAEAEQMGVMQKDKEAMAKAMLQQQSQVMATEEAGMPPTTVDEEEPEGDMTELLDKVVGIV